MLSAILTDQDHHWVQEKNRRFVMSITTESMAAWCRKLLGADPGSPRLTLEQYLAAIPRMECLGKLPSGTPVLVRGDTDAKPGKTVGEGDIRLRSMKETLAYGQQRGWKQIIFGHIGRDPEKSLDKVAARLGEILGCPVTFVADWLDPATVTIKDDAAKTIAESGPGSVIVLENTRKYDIERVLWKAKAADIDGLAENLAKLANEFAAKVAKVYIHEGFSAGSLDASSVVVPAVMEKVAMGKYEAEQFDGHLKECLDAQMVIFSGLKIDKLDDLQAMIDRGKIRKVIAAGSLAAGLKKAAMELEGKPFDLGLSQDPAHKGKPYYIPQERIEQAKRMLSRGEGQGDRVRAAGRFRASGRQSFRRDRARQPAVRRRSGFEQLCTRRRWAISLPRTSRTSRRPWCFHNGVFGMFEDPRFEEGTRKFMAQLKRMTDAGIKVYVGGGEGGSAIEKYGQPDWITYCFTAGGTVLNALGSEPVPYLVALRMAAEAMGPCPHELPPSGSR